MAAAWRLLAVLGAALALYLLFAGQLGWTELIAGLPASLAITAFIAAQHGGQHDGQHGGQHGGHHGGQHDGQHDGQHGGHHDGHQRRFHVRPPGRVLLAPLAALVTDTARVAAVLARAIAHRPPAAVGHAAPQPLRPGTATPQDAGRRAVITLASSLAPNGFVLDLPPSPLLGPQPALTLHRLAPAPPNPDAEWPV